MNARKPLEFRARKSQTLGEAAAVFFGQPGPRVIALVIAVSAAFRLRAGRASWTDAVTVLGVVLFWGFQEWVAHKYVLHKKPFRFLGREVDLLAAREHRAHHRAPWSLKETLLPLPVLFAAIPVNTALWLWLAPTTALALTGMTAYSAMALAYEWTHFLTHTSYVPRSGYYARICRAHRLHHFKDEHYWFGFTIPFVDALFRTSPSPRGMRTSATCRTLGVDD
jgi:hypothetical protein